MDNRESLTEQLFGEALEVLREGRSAFLEKACRGEPELRRAVEALLAENDRLSGFLSDSPHLRPEADACWPEANPGRREVNPIAITAADDLGITGDDVDAAFTCRVAERGYHALQQRDFQSFLEKYAERHVSRQSTADRQVVHGAVDRKRADVAARKLERLHGEAVGRYEEILSRGNRQAHGVGAGVEQRVRECGSE